MKLKTWMESKLACSEATQWVGDLTPAQAWSTCERPDWMLWALARTNIDKREIVRIACDVALSVLPLSDDPRVAAAIDAAEGWCEGTVTVEECRQATRDARSAGYAAADAAYADAAYAAYAAAYAADAAYAAYAAAYAADAAYAAAAWRQARDDARREIADLVRSRVSPVHFNSLVKGSK